MRVVDFDGNAAPKEVLRADVSGNLQDGVYDALKSNLSSAATRVVFLHYPAYQLLSVEYVGTMGHALDLDPRFFITHFQEAHLAKYWEKWEQPSRRHLDTSILQLRLADNKHLTTCVVQNIGKSL